MSKIVTPHAYGSARDWVSKGERERGRERERERRCWGFPVWDIDCPIV